MVSLQNKSCATTTRAFRFSRACVCVYVRVAAFPPAIEGTFPCVCRSVSIFFFYSFECMYRTIDQARFQNFSHLSRETPNTVQSLIIYRSYLLRPLTLPPHFELEVARWDPDSSLRHCRRY